MHDINYVDVKEPDDFYFHNTNGDMDVFKLLNDYYGVNNRGAATYYYMHGSNGSWNCMDEDNEGYIDSNDPSNNSVVLSADINFGQRIWAQIMSQCHSNPNSTVSLNGRGFWYKYDVYHGYQELVEGAERGIDLEFEFQNITECTDSPNQPYGCDTGDLGNSPT